MAEEVDEFGIPIRKQPTQAVQADEFGIPMKKKTGNGSSNGVPSSSVGLNNSLSTLQNTAPQRLDYAPVTDGTTRQQIVAQGEANKAIEDDNVRNQDANTQKLLKSGQFLKNLKALGQQVKQEQADMSDPITAKPYLEAQKRQREAAEAEEQRIRDEIEKPYRDKGFWGGVELGSKYLTSKLLKGTGKLVTGGLRTADVLARTVGGGDNTSEQMVTDFGNKVDELASLGIDKRYEGTDGVSRAIGGLAEMAPAIIGNASTGGASFFLQGVGNADEEVKRKKEEGVEFKNGSDDMYVMMNGLLNYGLMTKLNAHAFTKLPSAARQNIISKASADALNGLVKSGEPITAENLAAFGMSQVRKVADNLPQYLKTVGKGYGLTAADLSAFTISDAANKRLANKINEEDVFETPDAGEALQQILTIDAPLFGAIGAITNRGLLFDKSPVKNEVFESIKADPTPENAQRVKERIIELSQDGSFNEADIQGSLQTVDRVAKAVNSLPQGIIKPEKLNDAVDLVLGRDELQSQLSELQSQKEQRDISVKDIPTEQEQLLTDKIEQANDKLRSLATGNRTTYSKGMGEEEGKFFKTTNGVKEEITPSRYELEVVERDAKKQPIEEIETIKIEEEPTDAIQEPIPTEVDVRQQARDGKEVVERDTEIKTTSEKGEEVIQKEVATDEPIGVSKAETKKQREEYGMEDLPEAEKKTLSGMFEEGKQAVESKQINPISLAKEVADKPRNLSKEEVNALLYDRRRLKEEVDNVLADINNKINDENSTPETLELLRGRLRSLEAERDLNQQAVKYGTNQNALALSTMQNMINSDYSLSDQRARMRAIVGGELTEKMESELNRYKEELDVAKKKLADYETGNAETSAKKQFDRERAIEQRKQKKQVDKEILKTERKAIVSDFLSELEKIRKSGTLMSDIPYRRELQASVPFMRKLLTNLVKEGVVEFKDAIKTIHETFAEHIEGLTERDVMDVLNGKHNVRKETKNELIEQRANIVKLSKLTAKLEDLKNGVKKEKSERKIIKKRKDIQELEAQIKILERENRGEGVTDRAKESLKARIDKINERIKNNDYAESDPRAKPTVDDELITLQSRLRKAENNFDAMAERLNNHNRTQYEKNLDTFTAIRRMMILSGVKTLGKLYSFAGFRSLTTPIEEAFTTINSKIPFLSKIAKRSPRFSEGLNPTAEAKAITTRISKATLKDSWVDVLKTGVGELDRLYGKNGVDKDFDLNPSALEFFGRLHGAFKNSTKRAEFFRSMQKRLEYEARQGKDINDPNLQFRVGLEAYADGKRSILMNDNLIVDKGYKGLLRGLEAKNNGWTGKTAATAIRAMFPIVKIPTNFVVEALDVATFGARATPYIAKAMIKGAESLTPKEADMVMRTIAKGQIGLACVAIGYFNSKNFGGYYSGKRDGEDLKNGDITLFGQELPHWMAHNPYFEAMQIGATMRRAIDTANGNGSPEGVLNELTTSKKDAITAAAKQKADPKNPDSQIVEVKNGAHYYNVVMRGGKVTGIIKEGGVKEGIKNVAKGLSEQIPFTDLGGYLDGNKSLSNTLGNTAKNFIEPRLMQETAEYLDKDEKGEPIKRDPQNFTEQLKSGIPLLREQVEEKEDSSIPKTISRLKITDEKGIKHTYKLNKEQLEERQEIINEFIDENGDVFRDAFKESGLTNKDIEQRLLRDAIDYSRDMMVDRYGQRFKEVFE